MRNAVVIGSLAVLTLAMSFCSSPDVGSKLLEYEMQVVVESFGECQEDSSRCAVISLTYPQITEAAEMGTAATLNTEIKQFILTMPMDTVHADSVAEVVTAFGEEFQRVLSDFPDYHLGWRLDRTATVETDTLDIIAFKFSQYSYTGGAHPLFTVTYENFDATTGEKIQLTDIVAEDDLDSLVRLGDRELRKVHNIPDSITLVEAGFWFEDTTFYLTDNFLVNRTGLLFHYNAYEIGPYALGPTAVTIPYPDLLPLLRETSPIRKLAKAMAEESSA